MAYEWDAGKNEGNIHRHGIRFADAVGEREQYTGGL
jgi:uncharacterized DUF497 family protein